MYGYLVFLVLYSALSTVTADLPASTANHTLPEGNAPTHTEPPNRFPLGMTVLGILVVVLGSWCVWYRTRRTQYESVSSEVTV